VAPALKRPEAIQDVLAQACARNELVILVTPYLRFESFFVALGKDELQVAATMSREDASFGLRAAELKLRFPMGLGFMEAPVKLLGLGVHEGRRTLRLSLPKALQENDHRTEYRADRVGRVTVTYAAPRGDLLQAARVDLNTRGARIHTQKDLAATTLQVGSVLILSIPLADDLQIEARGEIRHMGPRTIGLEFTPRLPEEVEAPLSRWVFQRREEDQERLANIEELLTVARDFDERQGEAGQLEAFLEETCLVNDTDAWETEADRVTLMTLHASKGLEFPVVVLGSLKKIERGNTMDKLLEPVLTDKEPLELQPRFDAMRKFYVAMSRAQRLLIIHDCAYQVSADFKKFVESLPLLSELDFDGLEAERKAETALPKAYSFTGDFNFYRQCPMQYQIFKKFAFPPSRSQTMAFGSLVHQTLDDLHEHLNLHLVSYMNANEHF